MRANRNKGVNEPKLEGNTQVLSLVFSDVHVSRQKKILQVSPFVLLRRLQPVAHTSGVIMDD